jgi:hypothetical protein
MFFKHNQSRYKIFPRLKSIKNIGDVDVCLSLWNEIPSEIKNNNKIIKIIMIYDLIPIIMPELCNESMPLYFNNFLSSIDDTYQVLCISHNTKNDFLNFKKKINKESVHVVYLGADKKKFYLENDQDLIYKIKLKYGIFTKKYFLSLATLEPRKNFVHTIISFVDFVEKNNIDDVCLVIAGVIG